MKSLLKKVLFKLLCRFGNSSHDSTPAPLFYRPSGFALFFLILCGLNYFCLPHQAMNVTVENINGEFLISFCFLSQSLYIVIRGFTGKWAKEYN